jgi:hydrogenase expression/formation protein HypC
MCLAIPAKIEKILPNEMAWVNIGGIKKEISTALVSQIKTGDYVIVHVGLALSKMDEEEALETLKIMEEIDEVY